MHEIVRYIFIKFLDLPLFFSDGIMIAVIFWFAGMYVFGFIYSLIFN